MSCAEFDCWLDDGRPENERLRAIGHSAECIRCKRELVAAVDVERALAVVVPVAVGPGFNEHVLRTIHSRQRSRWLRAIGVFGQIMSEPLVPLSIAVAVMAGWYHELLALQLTAGANRVLRAIDGLVLSGELSMVRAMVIVALIFCVAWRIFRIAVSATT